MLVSRPMVQMDSLWDQPNRGTPPLPILLLPRTEKANRDVDECISDRPGGRNPRLSSFVSCLGVYRRYSSPFCELPLLLGPLGRRAVQLQAPGASNHSSPSCADYAISIAAGRTAERTRRDLTAHDLRSWSVQGAAACALTLCFDEVNHKQTWFLAVVDLG
jgi:hypothetical protein